MKHPVILFICVVLIRFVSQILSYILFNKILFQLVSPKQRLSYLKMSKIRPNSILFATLFQFWIPRSYENAKWVCVCFCVFHKNYFCRSQQSFQSMLDRLHRTYEIVMKGKCIPSLEMLWNVWSKVNFSFVRHPPTCCQPRIFSLFMRCAFESVSLEFVQVISMKMKTYNGYLIVLCIYVIQVHFCNYIPRYNEKHRNVHDRLKHNKSDKIFFSFALSANVNTQNFTRKNV